MSNAEIQDIKKHLEDKLDELAQLTAKNRKEDMEAIMAMLKPMSDTYNTANTAARWVKKLVVFAGLVIGLILSIKKLSQ